MRREQESGTDWLFRTRLALVGVGAAMLVAIWVKLPSLKPAPPKMPGVMELVEPPQEERRAPAPDEDPE